MAGGTEGGVTVKVTGIDRDCAPEAVSVMVRRGDWTNYLVIRPSAR